MADQPKPPYPITSELKIAVLVTFIVLRYLVSFNIVLAGQVSPTNRVSWLHQLTFSTSYEHLLELNF